MQGAVDPLHGDAAAQRHGTDGNGVDVQHGVGAAHFLVPDHPVVTGRRETGPGWGPRCPGPRATLAWPARMALSQPARTGKAMRRPVGIVQGPLALGRTADAAPVEAALRQPEHAPRAAAGRAARPWSGPRGGPAALPCISSHGLFRTSWRNRAGMAAGPQRCHEAAGGVSHQRRAAAGLPPAGVEPMMPTAVPISAS